MRAPGGPISRSGAYFATVCVRNRECLLGEIAGGAMLMKLVSGGQKYTRIPVPSLFIFANPHSQGTWVDSSADASVRSKAKAYSTALGAMTERQEESVESGVPAAHVITIPRGNHFVFLSNETQCLRAVQAFLSKLTRPN